MDEHMTGGTGFSILMLHIQASAGTFSQPEARAGDMHLMQQLDILEEVASSLHVCYRLTHGHRQAQVCNLHWPRGTLSVACMGSKEQA